MNTDERTLEEIRDSMDKNIDEMRRTIKELQVRSRFLFQPFDDFDAMIYKDVEERIQVVTDFEYAYENSDQSDELVKTLTPEIGL